MALGLAAAALLGALLLVFQPLASLVRQQREVRYLVTPANLLWSAGVVLSADARAGARPRRPIGLDAQPGPTGAKRERPLLLVLVVGETVRSANWGLAGYARQTTPQLAALPVVNFAQVTACGTNTEVSLPCMFAPVGRRDYDEARIRGSESLLHVLARAGVAVEWRDNQSGCKGVCDGLPSHRPRPQPTLCDGEQRCLDEVLLDGIDAELDRLHGTRVLVLHMLGNHGPSYFRRYPREFARFQPACESDDLRRCSDAQIVNAYDNALLYTDAVLARLVGTLQAHAGRVDSAMIYVSDHGESLGESGLVLHGLPYAIAPAVQTTVPMTLWWSDGFARATTLDGDCLRKRAGQPARHDHLFHTVLGLLDVRTALYAPAWDLSRDCRAS
jgi:lipid A ethanolaminephosphotransferase